MEISAQRKGVIDIITFKGNLDTNSAGEGEDYLVKLIGDDSSKVLINCSELEYISSAGLRVFLVAAKALKEKSGELLLCSLNEIVAEVFEISGFDTIFSTFDSEEEALGNF